jgi:hypothetical protein
MVVFAVVEEGRVISIHETFDSANDTACNIDLDIREHGFNVHIVVEQFKVQP